MIRKNFSIELGCLIESARAMEASLVAADEESEQEEGEEPKEEASETPETTGVRE